ncbi:MAG TPA: hypothetical protein ENJ82_10915, partial [Bacteroidetes bacterium]|nr:hypothetical protein [Bacteroidota bacterium]
MALLSDIDNITGNDSACSILQAPVLALRSAADSLDDMKNNPPAAIQELAEQMQGIEVPTIPGVDALAEGIRALKNELPDDPSTLTEPIAEALGDFFEGLENNVAGQLDDIIGAFSGLNALSEIGLNGPTNASVTDVLQEMNGIFDLIPDPLTVDSLLEFLRNGLQQFPRSMFPYRYLPLIDELRDKLETTLKWRDMTGAEISADLESTLHNLAAAIRRDFISDGVGVLT